MLSYIIIFFSLLIIPQIFPKRFHNSICFFILLIFMSIRFNVGWDFRWYYPLGEKFHFLNYSIFLDLKDAIIIMEESFDKYLWNYARLEFINKILYYITWQLQNPQTIIFLYSFLSLFFIKLGLDYFKRKRNVPYIWLFFYCFPLFFFKYVSIMRQAVAVSIIFYSYKFINKKLLKNFLFCVFIASLFHNSAKYMIILYLFNYIKLKRFFIYIIFLLTFFSKPLVLFCITKISFFHRYIAYVTLHKGGGDKIYYIILSMTIFLIIFWKKLVSKDPSNKKIMHIFFIGCSLYLSLNEMGHIGIRSSIYFLIFGLYLIPSIFFIFKGQQQLIKILYILGLFFLLNINLYLDKKNVNNSEFVPYRIFFINPNKLNDWQP